jgi:hypothetical protein
MNLEPETAHPSWRRCEAVKARPESVGGFNELRNPAVILLMPIIEQHLAWVGIPWKTQTSARVPAKSCRSCCARCRIFSDRFLLERSFVQVHQDIVRHSLRASFSTFSAGPTAHGVEHTSEVGINSLAKGATRSKFTRRQISSRTSTPMQLNASDDLGQSHRSRRSLRPQTSVARWSAVPWMALANDGDTAHQVLFCAVSDQSGNSFITMSTLPIQNRACIDHMRCSGFSYALSMPVMFDRRPSRAFR